MLLENPFKWQQHSVSTIWWKSRFGRGKRNNSFIIKLSPNKEKFTSKLNSLQSYIPFPLIFPKSSLSYLSHPPPYLIIFANSCHLEQFWEQWKSDVWEVKGNHNPAWNQLIGRILDSTHQLIPSCTGMRLLSSSLSNLGPLMVIGFRWSQNNSFHTVLIPLAKDLEDLV